MKRTLIGIAVGAILGSAAGAAFAGAFGIGTQSGSGTGNAFAGGAAAAEDASVVWSNPAAMSMLPQGRHVQAAAHLLRPSFKFQNQGSSAALGTAVGGDGGDWALVPNGYFATSLGNNLSFGIGVNAPFGLKTDYDAGWIGRFIGLKSEIKSVNINPSLSFKVSPSVSIGAGVSVQYLDAELTNAANPPLGSANLSADDIGYGFNLGIAVQATPSTRIGLAYRSSIKYELDGTASFSGLPAANASVKADLRVPDSVSISVFSAVTPQLDLMADVTWTGWSSIKAIRPICQQVSAACPAVGAALPGGTLPTNWKDTWRIGIGANYKPSAALKLRMGVAYDPTPTNDTDRTARLPDEDRVWLALGLQYAVSKSGKLDIAYAHEFIRDAKVNTLVGAGPLRQVGSFDNKADILTISYSHAF
ncbi:MAG: outer membrane protein transport protein [Burkholderiales bacterium]|nr:outer membrane protein transport protein [Burkholderiales bacterium]